MQSRVGFFWQGSLLATSATQPFTFQLFGLSCHASASKSLPMEIWDGRLGWAVFCDWGLPESAGVQSSGTNFPSVFQEVALFGLCCAHFCALLKDFHIVSKWVKQVDEIVHGVLEP